VVKLTTECRRVKSTDFHGVFEPFRSNKPSHGHRPKASPVGEVGGAIRRKRILLEIFLKIIVFFLSTFLKSPYCINKHAAIK